MASRSTIAIVGATATGKSDLALQLARAVGAHIVSADAFTAYREMDIGTAKPLPSELAMVRHYGIDVFDPSEDATLTRWLDVVRPAASQCQIDDVPVVVVGGTGLYVHAFVDDFDVPGQFPDVVATLEAEPDTPALYERLVALDPVAAERIEPKNRRRIVRALEVTLGSGRAFSTFGPGVGAFPETDIVLVGLRASPSYIDAQVSGRFLNLVERGLVDEVRALADRPGGWSRTARQAIGYKEVMPVIEGTGTIDTARAEVTLRTRQLARRQVRWFRRDPRVTWIDIEETPDLVDRVLRHWNR